MCSAFALRASQENLVNNRRWFFQIDLAHQLLPDRFQAGLFSCLSFQKNHPRKLKEKTTLSRCKFKHSHPDTLCHPSSNENSAIFRSRNGPASACPYKFLSNGTTRSVMLSMILASRSEENESGISTLSKTKFCVMNKMASGSKDMWMRSTGKRDDDTRNKEVTFIKLQNNLRSMHSSEKTEEMVSELEGYRWDAILLSQTWRHEQAEIWETHHKHIFMGAGNYDNKQGVGIMLNKRWRKRIIDTEYINERAITTTVLVNRQHIKLMSVYFPHSKYADHHVEKMYKTIEKHMLNNKKYIPIIGGDFNAELRPGKGRECGSVGRYTLNESNKRGDWLKSWLMLNVYSVLNTMFRKTPHKQTSFVSSKGKEKQIDYILTTWEMWRTLRPTTWSTLAVAMDVSWPLAWSTRPGRTPVLGGKPKNMKR